ncbi:hypothetical protein [Microcoleus sp.]|uniref:hypothetical protein n=1 Tax=Microcoleus sp. TaxID=44472 RepID=UPI00352565E2
MRKPQTVKSLEELDSYVKNPHTQKKSGYLTKTGMENFSGSHEQFYQEFIQQLHQPPNQGL